MDSDGLCEILGFLRPICPAEEVESEFKEVRTDSADFASFPKLHMAKQWRNGKPTAK